MGVGIVMAQIPLDTASLRLVFTGHKYKRLGRTNTLIQFFYKAVLTRNKHKH